MSVDKRAEMIGAIQEKLGETGKIRILVHSIAKGNLKPMHDDENPVL